MLVVFRAESVFKTFFFYLAYILKTKNKKKEEQEEGGETRVTFVFSELFFLLFLASHKDE